MTMNTYYTKFRSLTGGALLGLALLPAVWSVNAQAFTNLSGRSMADFTSIPVLTVESVTPLVMLAMSLDNQYFFKAYNDYSDLNGDGVLERTYLDSFQYYGYFHSERCYRYDDTSKTFAVVGLASGTNNHYCTGALNKTWSGNFLNWATMTRMDIVRKILFGGLRSTDTVTATVLERAHLPTEAHSFAKYYNGPDLSDLIPYAGIKSDKDNSNGKGISGNNNGFDDADEGITICNTTYESSGSSQGSASGPLMRVVKGNAQLWSANERWQCTWQNERGTNLNSNNSAQSGIAALSGDPPDSLQLKTPGNNRDHVVRIKVCEGTFFDKNRNLENCGTYGNNLKPEGLLQRYGMDGQIDFGLITGSYQKNISGGVLRKNVNSMLDEVDAGTGVFLIGGSDNTTKPGIIKTLSKIRIYGYGYNSGTFLSNDSGGDDCNFQLTDIVEGKCASWGNPMSEIFLEAIRYFAVGGSRAPTTAFDAVDSTYIAGLSKDSWTTDPLTSNNACAALNIIAFNASVSSYDDNQTNVYSPINAVSTTNAVGAGEKIDGHNFFIGRTGASTNEFCTAKTINALGDSFGLCPEAPTVRGSFHMAGEAYYAHTHDLRSSLEGDQKIRTFAVALATNTPAIKVPVGAAGPTTKTIEILPAYRLIKGSDPTKDGGGSLVDFKVVTPHTEVTSMTNSTPATGTGIFYAKFYVNWEDSEQGGDFDQDVWGTLEYFVDSVNKKIKIQTTAVAQSTVNGQLFGFITSGTTKDGFHAFSGIQGGNFTDPTGILGCTNCRALSESGGQRGAQSATFDISNTAAAGVLESPLFYAAKWGGFEDKDGDGTPNLQSEWDTKDTNGADLPGGDGIPDNFFFVTNPAALETSLSTVFNKIIERVSSGTAAAVVANDQEGTGALFQALYDPIKKDETAAKNEVEWIGTLHALWVDPFGFRREDGNGNGKLDGYDVDQVVEIFFDETDHRSKLRRFSSGSATTFKETTSIVEELPKLKPIWNARDQLAGLDESTITAQRAFDHPANEGRYILTWIDSNVNGVVDSGEVIDFTSTNITTGNFQWLDGSTLTDSQHLVDWTRGKDSGLTEFRKRQVDYAGDGAATINGQPEIMRLGDIINSTPVPVATPSEAFDLLALDKSYAEFREKYRNRRQVVYVGANDGMLHAFNGGFFDASAQQFKLQLNNETAHPLGSELWAYVPKNLLTQLQWFARKDYSHVYYMDLTPRVFDAKVFGADSDHPNGWGTLLVAGMRFGGGSDNLGIVINGNNNTASTADDVKTKSAYVIMDVTNPEKPPKILAEISPPELQYTTSFPQVITVANPTGSSPNKWYLVFGSGPSDRLTASFSSGAVPNQKFSKLFVYDLANLDQTTPATLNGLARTFTLTEPNVFVGDTVVADYDINMKADAMYFGTVGRALDTTETANTSIRQGSLYRVSIGEDPTVSDWSEPFKILQNVNKPFVSQPAVTSDAKFQHWIMAGSGRLYVNADKAMDSTQTLYGFIDPYPIEDPITKAPFSPSSLQPPPDGNTLIDVSQARVFSDNKVSLDGSVTANTKFADLVAQIETAGGWKRNYTNKADEPAERSVNRVSLVGGALLSTAFTPSVQLCGSEGKSELLALVFNTGTAGGFLGEQTCFGCPDGKTEKISHVDLGKGLASTPSVHLGNQDVPGRVTIITQSSTGAINATTATIGASIKNGEISWREYRGE